MTDDILKCSVELVDNMEIIREVFPQESRLVQLSCAGILACKGVRADAERLKRCRELTGKPDSSFLKTGNTLLPMLISMTAAEEEPERLLLCAGELYELLGRELPASGLLCAAAMELAGEAAWETRKEAAARAGRLYGRMREENPDQITEKSGALCAFMAFSPRPDSGLLQDTAACYRLLREVFPYEAPRRTVSCMLAMSEEAPEEKCARAQKLAAKLQIAGLRYGTYYELPVLSAPVMAKKDPDETVADIVIVQSWLAKKLKRGIFDRIPERQLLMYAGLIVGLDGIRKRLLHAEDKDGGETLRLLQKAAVCAAAGATDAAKGFWKR